VLNDRTVEPGVSYEEFHDVAALGRRQAIDELLMRFPASARIREPVAIALRGMKAVTAGDVAGGIALLKRAASHCDKHLRRYIFELLIPLLINTNETDEAAKILVDLERQNDYLEPAFDALRSVIAARQGDDQASAAHARVALETGRASDNPVIIGRVLMRAAWAAFYREDVEEAQERSLEAARWHERLDSHRNASLCYSFLYVISHNWIGDPDVARFYARRMTMSAHLAEDAGLENFGLMYQLETAAEAGDSRRFGSIRARLLANPMNEQYFRSRFSYVLADALSAGWTGSFDIARSGLMSIRQAESLPVTERALCDALLAVIALTTWQLDDARTLARRAIGMSSERTTKEALFEARGRRIARIVAASVCIILGDAVRGRRALSRRIDPEQRFAAIITPEGMDEIRTPSLMRGYARFINNACRVAALARPQIGLTDAELEVLHALPEGTTLATIATSLGKSRKTVEKQVGSIYSKLNVNNRAQAVRRARDLGLFA
jgi:DNA-binding CsgD family transcriptional regulator